MDAIWGASELLGAPKSVPLKPYAIEDVVELSLQRTWHLKNKTRARKLVRKYVSFELFAAWLGMGPPDLQLEHLVLPDELYRRVEAGWHDIQLKRSMKQQHQNIKDAKALFFNVRSDEINQASGDLWIVAG